MEQDTGRVIEVHRTNIIVKSGDNEFTATVRGTFHQDGEFPKVGDNVVFEKLTDDQAVITKVLERKNVIARRAADSDEEQIIVTNVDLVGVVMGLDGDFNISRLERYLQLAAQSETKVVVILNKKDVAADFDNQVREVKSAAGDVPVLTTAAVTGEGLEELKSFFSAGTTAVLLGSSGSGKSTITNWLLEENRQIVQEIREDDSRGRHTTTSRQLFALPNGGFIIDTPGMRELGMIGDESSDTELWQRVGSMVEQCRFRNCDHDKSAGCAVLAAVESGRLTSREVKQYLKLQAEQEFLSDQIDNKTRFKQQNDKRRAKQQSVELRKRLSRR
tara:strand:+ start:3038 stop:4030 length:993 start_codon:yes stop_codon:yes gene_type:complete